MLPSCAAARCRLSALSLPVRSPTCHHPVFAPERRLYVSPEPLLRGHRQSCSSSPQSGCCCICIYLIASGQPRSRPSEEPELPPSRLRAGMAHILPSRSSVLPRHPFVRPVCAAASYYHCLPCSTLRQQASPPGVARGACRRRYVLEPVFALCFPRPFVTSAMPRMFIAQPGASHRSCSGAASPCPGAR